ncbi:MAG TPA: M20/M25/M40 family metallo-hydrolase [Bacteroidales bacterium]|nr:M20/M25/M40 family metallo-hydrolase [Bacteroidales bacterium]
MKKIFLILFLCFSMHICTRSQQIALPQTNATNAFLSLPASIENIDSSPIKKAVHDSLIGDVLTDLNADSIMSYIQHLQAYGTRFLLAPGHKDISLWLQHKLISFGYTNAVLDSFEITVEWPVGSGNMITNIQYNVIAELSGLISPDVQYVIGAHYDDILQFGGHDPYLVCPGADDNASGTAAVMEIARVLKERNFSSPATLRFVFFDAEELGTFGSRHFVEDIMAGIEKPEIMFNLDMVGHEPADTAWLLQFNNYLGNEWICSMGAEVAAEYTQLGTFNLFFNEPIGSDSDPFFLAGLPAIFLQEDDFSPYYHTLADVDSTINGLYCREIARLACAMLMNSSLVPTLVDFEISNPGDGHLLVPRWRPNPENNIAGYRVYFGTSPSTYDTVYATADTSLIFSGLSTDTLYYISVSAVNTEGREGIKNELNDRPAIVNLDQGILIVDDSEGGFFDPPDSVVDAYYRYLCSDFNVAEYDATQNGPLTLAVLGPYSSVVWHINRANIIPKLRSSLPELRQYMQLGGNVFFTIFQPSKMLDYTDDLQHTWQEGSFLHDMLKTDSTKYLTGAVFIGGLPLITGYHMLDVDTNKTYPAYNHHLFNIQAVYPSVEGSVVYSYDTDYDSTTAQGIMKGLPVGVEYRGDYNAVLLSFPLYYMDSIQSKIVMQYVLQDVFGELPVLIDEKKPGSLAVNVFPNPAQGSFVIRTTDDFLQKKFLDIYDVTGRQILSVTGMQGNENKIDVSRLQSGIYFLRITGGNRDYNIPMVIVN